MRCAFSALSLPLLRRKKRFDHVAQEKKRFDHIAQEENRFGHLVDHQTLVESHGAGGSAKGLHGYLTYKKTHPRNLP